MNRIAVIGANGQLGSRLCEVLGERALPVTRTQMTLESYNVMGECIEQLNPDAIINAAAYTNVEKAEDEHDTAHNINCNGAAFLAVCARDANIPYIHISTDYVFDGTKSAPYTEADATRAINAYGKSKEEGEKAVMQANQNAFIARVSWLYDARGKNFFTTIADKLEANAPLKIISDQLGTPCFAPDIARALVTLLDGGLPHGIHHLVHQGDTSWYGFATAIRTAMQAYIEPLGTIEAIPSSAYTTRAKRPANSRLDASLLYTHHGLRLPLWNDAVERAVKERYAH